MLLLYTDLTSHAVGYTYFPVLILVKNLLIYVFLVNYSWNPPLSQGVGTCLKCQKEEGFTDMELLEELVAMLCSSHDSV